MKKVNLRKLAKGQDCMIRAPGCNFNPETTVLAHLPGGGMGAKRHDLLGAWACSQCHDLVDGRSTPDWLRDESDDFDTDRKFYHMRGVYRTLEKLIEMGVINV